MADAFNFIANFQNGSYFFWTASMSGIGLWDAEKKSERRQRIRVNDREIERCLEMYRERERKNKFFLLLFAECFL